jgi:hypothetical protein
MTAFLRYSFFKDHNAAKPPLAIKDRRKDLRLLSYVRRNNMKILYNGIIALALCLVAVLMWYGLSPNPRNSRLLAPVNWLFSVAKNDDAKKTFEKVKQANLTSKIDSNALSSYRSAVCVFPNKGVSAITNETQCLKGYSGVYQPSATYLSLVSGNLQIIQIVNGNKGWQFTVPLSAKTKTLPANISDSEGDKLKAIKENAKHSLPALFQLLSSENGWQAAKLEIIKDPSSIVIRWQEGDSTNDFHFSQETFLCEKQIRRTGQGVTILKYFDYKNTGGVMLPQKIEVSAESGQIVATQVVESWTLGVVWPDNFFTPEGVLKGF